LINDERWALITGSSHGIGKATAQRLAQEGINLVLHYGHDSNANELLIEQLRRRHNIRVDSIQADFRYRDEVERVIEYAKRYPVTMVVNNAGSLLARHPWAEIPDSYWEECIALNLSSVYWVLRGIVPLLREGSAVVNVSSIAAFSGGGPGAFVYAAAKSGVNALTKGLAKELAPRNIRVNAVAPGTIDTRYHAQFSTPQGVQQTVESRIPLRRMGMPDECADLIMFLLSSRASFITGSVYVIDGGQSLSF
jgi:3-oxoacyl-[acyl-carrier protein] reductase